MIIEINKRNIATRCRAFVSDAKGNCEVPYTFHKAYDYNIYLNMLKPVKYSIDTCHTYGANMVTHRQDCQI